MRKIKFRGWDAAGQFMFDSEFFRCGLSEGPAGVLMQFTGLHDKKGKEIYEGDIRRSTYFSGADKENIEYEHVAVMKWDERNACFSWETVKGYWNDWMGTEVIGNIYENPDLLSQSQ